MADNPAEIDAREKQKRRRSQSRGQRLGTQEAVGAETVRGGAEQHKPAAGGRPAEKEQGLVQSPQKSGYFLSQRITLSGPFSL